MTTNSKNEKNQNNLTANITHELKTPLTSIIGFIELLKKNGEKDKETRDYFYNIIDAEAQRLLHLIDDILLLSQVENNENNTSIQQCSIKKELKTVLNSLIPLVKKKNINVEINVKGDPIVSASSMHLQQLFYNLIGNAIKYNKINGKIIVNCFSNNQFVTISIKDTGIGIDASHINKIFDRFYRVNSNETSDIPGNGLGLSIVKDIITLYNGKINLNSKVGEGSEFIISFPTPGKNSI